ncbi:POT family-domain-containing protein [Gaertneriomyces semiglobifer]|nr:POT family-domain-containing protein [Gaertneriomyces semiglobifer]
MSDDKKDRKVVEADLMEADGITEEVRQHMLKEKEMNKHIDEKLAQNPDKLPKAIYFIIPNELGERFCYYGVQPLLKNYFQNILGQSKHRANSLVHTWKAITYFCPLIGAAVSDSWLDKYKTIVSLSFVYLLGLTLNSVFATQGVIGTITSAVTNEAGDIISEGTYLPTWGALLSLYLISLGTGGIKPCVSAHGGDQFLDVQEYGLNKFYNYFYMSINVGAVVSSYVTPVIKDKTCYGLTKACYSYAFGFCTIVFGIALGVFIFGKRYYRVVPPAGVFIPGQLAKTAITWIVSWVGSGFSVATARTAAAEKHGNSLVVEMFDVARVMMALLPAPFFWMAFDQNGTSWQGLTDQMNTRGFLTSEQINSIINPLLIVILAPIFANFIYPTIDKVFGKGSFGLLRRMCLGMFFCASSFIVCGIMQKHVTSNCKVETELIAGKDVDTCIDRGFHAAWFLIPYFLMTTGEVLFSISGLNFTYQEVGKRTKSSSAAIWLLGTGIGNFLSTALFESAAGRGPSEGGWETHNFFFLNAGLCCAAGVAQIILAKIYVYKKDRPDYHLSK